jgi:DNA/RNA-binding domain of Phe-tRNA-synthetase-like protein
MAVFCVSSKVFEQFPDYLVIVLVADRVENRRHIERARTLLAESARLAWERWRAIDPKALPEIDVWRRAFRRLGWSASTYQSSIEALVRRTLKGNPPPSINPAVDLANAASLRFLVPIGAHDLATAPNGLTVRASLPGDRFLPLGDGAPEEPEVGEIVYVHDHDVRTRRWVWRQSRTGLVTPDSRTILFPIDAFQGVTAAAAVAAADWLSEQLQSLLGATVQRGLVDLNQPVFDSALGDAIS